MSKMPSIRSRGINVVQEIPISKTLKFWEGLKEGKIYGTRCIECGKTFFPPNLDCAECHSNRVEWVELSNDAKIETFTRVVVRPTTFQQYQPYTVAIGKLKENVKVLAWLTGFKLSEIEVGMHAKLVAKINSEGNPTYEFVPP